MTNRNKYEKIYQEDQNACGPPFKEFVDFFQKFEKNPGTVLDLGCGQGRDALFIARQGHHVLGVDLSETGIAQMLEAARKDNLQVEGVVADVVKFDTDAQFDVVILDRVLHLLPTDDEKLLILKKASECVNQSGFLLIADTPKQKVMLQSFFNARQSLWTIEKQTKGFLFVQKKRFP